MSALRLVALLTSGAALLPIACGGSSGSSSGAPSGSDGGGGSTDGGALSDGGAPIQAPCSGVATGTIFEPGTGGVRFAVGAGGAFLCRNRGSTADAESAVEIYARVGAGPWVLERTVEEASACAIAQSSKGEVAVTVDGDDGIVVLRRGAGAWTPETFADVPDRSNPVGLVFDAEDEIHFVTATSPSFGVDRLVYGARGTDGGLEWVDVDKTTNSFGVLDNLIVALTPAGVPHFLYRHSPRQGDEETLKHATRLPDGGFASEILPLGGRDDGRRTSMAVAPGGEVHVSASFDGILDEAVVHFARSGDAWAQDDVQRHQKTAGRLLGPTEIGIDGKGRLRVVYANDGDVVVATRDGDTWTKSAVTKLRKNAAGFEDELLAARLGPDDRLHLVVGELVADGLERARVAHVATCPLP